VTNPVILPSFYFMQDVSALLNSVYFFFISHMIGPTNLLHPSPAPRFETSPVFLINISKEPSFSIIQDYASHVEHY